MKNYRVVSGTPRSGTSINMRIHGTKFTLEGKQFPRESLIREEDSEFVRYMKSKRNSNLDTRLNPKGFFEDGRFCMTGLAKSVQCNPLPKEGACIKIIGVGLRNTDPTLIKSVLFSLRHPFEVAEAQKDLKGVEKLQSKMWVRDLLTLIDFMEFAPEVPVLISSYTELCLEPERALKKYSDFYGEDFSGAVDLIAPHEPRPTPDLKGQEWERVLDMYHAALEGDWQGVKDAQTKVIPTDMLPCPRVGRAVSKSQCDMCYKNTRPLIDILKKRSDENKVDWDQEPCRVDCETMTVEQSIKQNHWR